MRKYNNQRGAALAFIIIVMAVLIILGTATLKMSVSESNFAAKQEDKLQAYYLARSGAVSIAEYMIRDANNDAHELVDKSSVWNEQISGGKFKVEVKSVPSSKDIDIISTGEFEQIQQQVKMRVTGSASGVGGLFQYAIAAKDNVTVDNSAGTGIEITGSIATKNGTISLGSNGKIISGEKITDPNLIFPAIVLPPDRSPSVAYDQNLGTVDVQGTTGPTIITSSSGIKHVRANSIYLKNSKFNVTGNGIAHLFVQGDIMLDTQANFEVASTAKLYVYVIGNRNVTLKGNGVQSNLFIYAPDSTIRWNNASAGDIVGSIVGKEVILFNHTKIKYNPDMLNHVELDHSGSGVTYTGYIWMD